MSAPIGNVNAMKNGRRSSRPGTVLQRVGPRFSQAYQDVLRLRRGVEDILKRKYGRVTLLQAAKVQTLCRLELNCRIAEVTIKVTPGMGVEELRAQRSCIAQWTCQRDNALAALVGDCPSESDPWAVLDRKIQPPPAEHAAEFGIDQGNAGSHASGLGEVGDVQGGGNAADATPVIQGGNGQ